MQTEDKKTQAADEETGATTLKAPVVADAGVKKASSVDGGKADAELGECVLVVVALWPQCEKCARACLHRNPRECDCVYFEILIFLNFLPCSQGQKICSRC